MSWKSRRRLRSSSMFYRQLLTLSKNKASDCHTFRIQSTPCVYFFWEGKPMTIRRPDWADMEACIRTYVCMCGGVVCVLCLSRIALFDSKILGIASHWLCFLWQCKITPGWSCTTSHWWFVLCVVGWFDTVCKRNRRQGLTCAVCRSLNTKRTNVFCIIQVYSNKISFNRS
jgi:hypothetical protein